MNTMDYQNHSSSRSGAQRPAQPKAPVHDVKANAHSSQRNVEMSKTMRLKKKLNHQPGLSPLEQHPTASHAVASVQPLELSAQKKKLQPLPAEKPATLNVLDAQNVQNVIRMVHTVNTLVQRQYDRHSDAALAKERLKKMQMPKRMSVTNCELPNSPRLGSMTRTRNQSLKKLTEQKYQLTSKITMVRRGGEPKRPHFNPNETGMSGLGSYGSTPAQVGPHVVENFLARERYSTQDSTRMPITPIFQLNQHATQHPSPRQGPKALRKHFLNTQDAAPEQQWSFLDNLATPLADLDSGMFNVRSYRGPVINSYKAGQRMRAQAPGADNYDFGRAVPTRSKYGKSISTMNTDKTASLRQQASPFTSAKMKMSQNVTAKLPEQASSRQYGPGSSTRASKATVHASGDTTTQQQRQYQMQGQTFGGQFKVEDGAPRHEGGHDQMNIQHQFDASVHASPNMKTVLPSIAITKTAATASFTKSVQEDKNKQSASPSLPSQSFLSPPYFTPYTKATNLNEASERLSAAGSNAGSRAESFSRTKSMVAQRPAATEEASKKITSRRVSKRSKFGLAHPPGTVLHFKGAFDDGVPEGMGPNDMHQMSVLDTLKGNDVRLEGMAEVADDIFRAQQNNPNSARQHLLEATNKFQGAGAAARGKFANDESEQKKSKTSLKDAANAPVARRPQPKAERPQNFEERKYSAMEQEMKEQQAKINSILNRYNASSMTSNQASRSLLRNQIDKWARRMKMANEGKKAAQGAQTQAPAAMNKAQLDKGSRESLGASKMSKGRTSPEASHLSNKDRSLGRGKSKPAGAHEGHLDPVGESLTKDQAKLTAKLSKFAKDLFQFWDHRDYGKLDLRTISYNFLSLGLALSTEQVIQTFQPQILSQLRNEDPHDQEAFVQSDGRVDLKRLTLDRVGHVEIAVGEFTAIFKGGDYCQKMLTVLNKGVRERNQAAEALKKQRDDAQRQKAKMAEALLKLQEAVAYQALPHRQKQRMALAQSTQRGPAAAFASKQKNKSTKPQVSPASGGGSSGSAFDSLVQKKGVMSQLSLQSHGQGSPREQLRGPSSSSLPRDSNNGARSSRMLGLLRAGLLEQAQDLTRRSQLRAYENPSPGPGAQASQTSAERGAGKSTSKFESPGAHQLSFSHIQSHMHQNNSPQRRAVQNKSPQELRVPPRKGSILSKMSRSKREKESASGWHGTSAAPASALEGDLHDVQESPPSAEQREQKRELEKLEKQYAQALLGAHTANLNEMRIDHNDAVRSFLLDTLLHNIRKNFRPYREDLHFEKEILQNSHLEQARKLEYMRSRKAYDEHLKRTYGSGRGYHIFRELMLRLVSLEEQKDKEMAARQKELREKIEKKKKSNFRSQFEQSKKDLIARLNGEQSQSAIEQSQRLQAMLDHNQEVAMERQAQLEERGHKRVNYGLEPEYLMQHDTEETQPIRKLMRALVTDQFKLKRQQVQLSFPNQRLSELSDLLEVWWREKDTTFSREMPIKDFSDLMMKKGVVAKSFETVRMIKQTIGDKIEPVGLIRHSQYMRLFAKPLLKAALINVYYYIRKVANRDGTDVLPGGFSAAISDEARTASTQGQTDDSQLLYVLKLQRALALSGMKPNNGLAAGFDTRIVVDAVIEQQQIRERERQEQSPQASRKKLPPVDGADADDDLSKINQMKKRLDKEMQKLKDDPYAKISLRAQQDREKHKELREGRAQQMEIVEQFDTFQELMDNAAKYGPDSQANRAMLLKKEQDKEKAKRLAEGGKATSLEDESGIYKTFRKAAGGAHSKVNLEENKIAYQICKSNLARQAKLLDFLDEEHESVQKTRPGGVLQQKGGQPRSPRTGAGDIFKLISGPGALDGIDEAASAQQGDNTRHLTQGLQMTTRLNMISSDSEGEAA